MALSRHSFPYNQEVDANGQIIFQETAGNNRFTNADTFIFCMVCHHSAERKFGQFTTFNATNSTKFSFLQNHAVRTNGGRIQFGQDVENEVRNEILEDDRRESQPESTGLSQSISATRLDEPGPSGLSRPVRPPGPTGPNEPTELARPTGPARSTGLTRPTGPVRPATGPGRPATGPGRPATGQGRPTTAPGGPATGRYKNGELFFKHSRSTRSPIIKMANFFRVIKMANNFL